MTKPWLVTACLVFGFQFVFAQDVQKQASRLGFYTIKETNLRAQMAEPQLEPLETLEAIVNDESFDLSALKSKIVSLLDFDFHNEKYGNTRVPYDRLKHFGTWVRDPRDNTCYNTRAKVLIRDSISKVSFAGNGCTVSRGKWDDPYGGRQYTDSRDVQIDHFVPLKNAYFAGAFKWNKAKRCLYANFMGNDFHLLAVAGLENQTKLDHTPEDYMPPEPSYQCQYLAQWLKVKLIWGLALTVSEKSAVMDLIRSNHCKGSDLTFTAQELQSQRQFIDDNLNLCP